MKELSSTCGSKNNDSKLFSIGHSNVALERFILLLQVHEVDILVDVRSRPYSRWASQFSQGSLKNALNSKGIKYVFLGKELGGRPDSEEFYDVDGHVLYGALSTSNLFLQGIDRLKSLARDCRLALMCSEENPTECHRRLLVARVLERQGIIMEHIRGDGRIQTEDKLKPYESNEGLQLSMLPEQEGSHWRSVKPIRSDSPNGERETSLGL